MLKFLDVNAHLSPTQAKILLEIRILALLLLRLVREGLLRLLCRAVAVRLLVPSLLGRDRLWWWQTLASHGVRAYEADMAFETYVVIEGLRNSAYRVWERKYGGISYDNFGEELSFPML